MTDTTPVPMPPLTHSPILNRRQFIQMAAASVGAAWLGLLAQSRLFPAQNANQSVAPIEIALSELPVGGSKSFLYGGQPAIVLRTPESVRAFSLICTHLGCNVQWQSSAGEGGEFYCPCHDGRFDAFGEVLAGPPPVPLEQLPVTVEKDRVIIGEAV